jgi:hypothetical protein
MASNFTIGQFGQRFKGVQEILFSSKESLLDYDFIFLDPISLANGNAAKFNTTYVHMKPGSFEILVRRKKELAEFLSKGKYLFVFTPFPHRIYDSSVNSFGQMEAIIPEDIKLVHSEGKKIEFMGNHPLTTVLKKFSNRINYIAYFENDFGQPLARVKETGKVVSLVSKNIIYLPNFNDAALIEADLIPSLIEALAVKDKADFIQPEWSKKYLLRGESEIQASILAIEDKVKNLNQALKNEYDQAAKIESLKTLFTGSGNFLETQIQLIFEEFGFKVLEADPNRDDLILEYNGKIAVVEIKGVSASAAEKQSAQLEKWVSEYHINHDNKPKGILIVNSFRETELSERTEPTFPHQMLKYAENRDHCLMSGIQLLGLYFDFQANAEKRDLLINSLFDTVGVYKGYENWQSYVTTAGTRP